MLIKPRRQIGTADVSDLSRNPIIKWQHKFYLYLIVGMGFVLPTLVAGLGWGDWKGGFYFAGAARLCFVHHVRVPLLCFFIASCPPMVSCVTLG